MRRSLTLVLSGLVALVVVAFALVRTPRRPPLDAGVPLTLAESRAARVSNLRYEVTLTIPPARTSPITGSLQARFVLKDAAAPLAFDFAQPRAHLHAVGVNGERADPAVDNGHIVLAPDALVAGENVVEFEFTAGDAPLNRHDDFLYSLFVPARASLSMPVFDQPDLKARWRLILNIPPGWTAVANAAEVGRTNMPTHTGLIFDETPPLSTYLFAFAAGRFTIETGVRHGRTYRLFHRETDAAKVARNRDAIFDLHARALAWLEDYTAVPYPFGKFDVALIPSFQFGGMEHPGVVFYNASSLFLDDTATQLQHLGRASVIAHETAHMWFGDLVTMRWFNDVWLKEVFANFMAARIVNPSFPAVNHELRFLFQHYPSAYDVDRTPGANPIRQPLSNLHDAGSLYGPIIYQKAPIVMRQLELVMGAEPFRDGLRQYLGNHAFGNATWLDLVTLLDERTAVDLQAWSRAWVDSEGRPRLTTQLATAAGRIERLTIEQTDPRGRPLHWPQRIRVLVDAGQPGGPRAFDVALTGASADVSGARGLPEPRWVVPVGGGLAYGDVVLPPGTLDHLAATLAGIGDAVTRGAVTVLLWESMLEGRLSASRMVDALAAALDREPDELNVGQMLEYLRAGFWRFTPADDRPALARRIEPLLSDGLARARSTSAKAAWFGALRSVATTPEMLGWLEQVWRRRTTIPGLPLSETDETDLVLDLAVRDVESADAMVIAQLGRIENADRRARFEFIQPAVSRDAATREAFFEGLKDAGNRRREAWVLEGLRYLHHPLRAASSRRLVVPSLALVWDIQRTGDIFFPKRWADATLSGYQSAQTSAEVQSFIAGLPADYPPRLKWILQSAADPLARAAR